MKLKTVAVGLAASAAVASAASATVVINVPGWQLANGESFTHQVVLGPGLDIIGFSFIGDYTDIAGLPWASDTRLQIYRDGVELYNIGGYPSFENPWDFQGGDSAPSGTYGHGIFGAPHGGDGMMDTGVTGSLEGTWDFVFTQNFGTAAWDNVEIHLHQIPAPGALALLGVAGLAGVRRRRRE